MENLFLSVYEYCHQYHHQKTTIFAYLFYVILLLSSYAYSLSFSTMFS
nr:MAG TPA: hypothetical protein [Bacteriophage sp.]